MPLTPQQLEGAQTTLDGISALAMELYAALHIAQDGTVSGIVLSPAQILDIYETFKAGKQQLHTLWVQLPEPA